MKTAVVIAIAALVLGLAAFNFSRFSSDERETGVPVAPAVGTTPADDGSAAGDAEDHGVIPEREPVQVHEEVRAEGRRESGDDAGGRIGASGPPVATDRSESRATSGVADRSRGEVEQPAAAAPERHERRRRSRWYRRPEPDLSSWTRPEGPPRVALQAGHWKAHEAPDEQAGLRNNGTRGGGKEEWELNLAIARKTAALLEAQGFTVDILPTTITPNYWADVFVSIHADGNSNGAVSGYRAASPRRDRTGRAAELAELITRTYGEATGLPHYPTITRRMRSYYAFNYRRYEHSLHPMTVGVIIETGFLTSPRDRRVIVHDPDRAARGIAEAVMQFLTP